jgi:hypothetical protein
MAARMSGLVRSGRAGAYLSVMMLASEKTRNSARKFENCLFKLS